MTPADWVILALAVAGVAGAVVFVWRRKKRGKTSCGGGCGSCPYSSACKAVSPDSDDGKSGETCQKPPTAV